MLCFDGDGDGGRMLKRKEGSVVVMIEEEVGVR